jgi:hypothetical protein
MSDAIAKTSIRPKRKLSLLSHQELDGLMKTSDQVYRLFRQCALAVLNSGNMTDDGSALLKRYPNFDVRIVPQSRGFKLELINAPSSAYVDGMMIQGIQDHVFSSLRDIVFCQHELSGELSCDNPESEGITDVVFRILRNADVVKADQPPNLVVCWGGHSISRREYEFTKEVGYHLGLRGLNIATGCGIGAMKGPMKGAAVGHAKQQIKDGRYIGITEPGIIAAEPPNALVNELVILPDIEKRLEAFVRLAHTIVVFPGGAGTAEEVLYILSILMQKENQHQVLPIIFASSEKDKAYFESLDTFLRKCLGDDVARYYKIVTESPVKIAEAAKAGVQEAHKFRRRTQESYGFNWQLYIPHDLQKPFLPTHQNMASLKLLSNASPSQLSVDLRAAFSGIVAGNVKQFGIEAVAAHGPYQLNADEQIGVLLEELLQGFIQQGRMSLKQGYKACFEIKNC